MATKSNSAIYDAIFGEERTINIKVNGHKIRVTYDRSFYSVDSLKERGREEADAKERLGENTPEYADYSLTYIRDSLADVLLSWDLVDPEGQPVPITPEIIGKMSAGVIQQVWEQLGEDASPKLGTR